MNKDKLVDLSKKIKIENTIDKNLYDKFSIKRGLRNKNGTGVLVGVTKVGDVCGYKIENGEKIPSKGELFYRGYPLTKMVEDFNNTKRFGFEEIIYLLLFNKLANKNDLESFKKILVEERNLPNKFFEDTILNLPGNNIVNIMMRSVLALYSYDEMADDTDTLNVLSQSLSLISKMPIIAIYSYQVKIHNFDGKSLVIHNQDENKSIAENILSMLRIDQKYKKEEAEILDLLLIIHAEHGGGNNSAFATHVVSSSGTDTYSAIATGLGSLKGPRHGGANLKVSQMLENIRENLKNIEDEKEIEKYLKKILDKKAFDKKGLIYGLGHAVYTISDPRAVLLKEKARELSKIKNRQKDFEFIEKIEKIGGRLLMEKLKKPYPICANVDLYSGFCYEMLDIPKDLYIPIFAIARTVGWAAHRLEQIEDSKIIRPAYKSLSQTKKYLSMDERWFVPNLERWYSKRGGKMNILKNYFKFILKQDVDSKNSSKAFILVRILSFLIAGFFSWGLYYLLDRYNLNIFVKYLILIYASLAFFTTLPCKTIQMREDENKLSSWIPNFGFYNSLAILISPIYLFKYCKVLQKNKEN